MTHKSELLNLVLNKLGLSKSRQPTPNANTSTIIHEPRISEVKKSTSANSIKVGIIFILLITASIVLIASFLNSGSTNELLDSKTRTSQQAVQKAPQKITPEEQIHSLMRDEKIQVASQKDIDNWMAAASRNNESNKHRMYLGGRSYIVSEQITFPDGMYGSHSRSFILKENVKLPFGDIAHNTVYFMSDGKCLGTGCR
ncbi:hypothetical protein OO007_12160 [Cocleimonas sp. KMM 6892]|uniref:hypothetical protein n=1 Tax=unclassified Cocleimonas TaxID=2639732 RepID=UPI002DBED727|nr:MULTISPECIES: hypothetical protein [unclassified Cocleimonas]MEB8432982.1 hypothetical protein [Cocleimonas sp. KMM 6892]MEC4716037.1 hypothetical protein [Cocleimonas sp. KMM 6895]MEC4745498.1 hypothetical protein [Cocleimonas sp. KMM 6896]